VTAHGRSVMWKNSGKVVSGHIRSPKLRLLCVNMPLIFLHYYTLCWRSGGVDVGTGFCRYIRLLWSIVSLQHLEVIVDSLLGLEVFCCNALYRTDGWLLVRVRGV